MSGYEAVEDDAAPGEWIILDIAGDEAKPGPTTVARFYGPDAQFDARDHVRLLNSIADDQFPLTSDGGTIAIVVVLVMIAVIGVAVGLTRWLGGW